MKKLLNTIYVTSSEAALRKHGENLVVDIEDNERIRVPLHMVGGVVVFGPVLLTPGLIMACTAGSITLTLCDRNGRFQGRIEGPVSGNVLLRKAQYAASDNVSSCANIVRALLIGKVSNQRQVLARSQRDYSQDYDEATKAIMRNTILRLAKIVQKLLVSDDVDAMRGLEGDAARMYFAAFPYLMRTTIKELKWRGRTRRPPLDPMNALLSFLYTLLTHDCRSGAESVGLDPAVGFLHKVRPGRPSLALDLMEELRPILADRLALSLINRKQVKIDDFETKDNGAVLLKDDARRTVLTAWQERKRDERLHPFLNESTPLGLVPYLQAQMLARHLRGDLDSYPPWLWR